MTRGADGQLLNPDYTGGAGRAWELTSTATDVRVEHTAHLGGWLIEAPFAVPAWNYHLASLVHLRDIPGTPKPHITLPGDTHEFMMHALDPRFEDEIDPADTNTLKHLLRPVDMVEQLRAPNDERALGVVRFAIQKCVDGKLLADSDGRRGWQAFFRLQEQ